MAQHNLPLLDALPGFCPHPQLGTFPTFYGRHFLIWLLLPSIVKPGHRLERDRDGLHRKLSLQPISISAETSRPGHPSTRRQHVCIVQPITTQQQQQRRPTRKCDQHLPSPGSSLAMYFFCSLLTGLRNSRFSNPSGHSVWCLRLPQDFTNFFNILADSKVHTISLF